MHVVAYNHQYRTIHIINYQHKLYCKWIKLHANDTYKLNTHAIYSCGMHLFFNHTSQIFNSVATLMIVNT